MGIGQLLKDQLSLTLNLPTRLLLCRLQSRASYIISAAPATHSLPSHLKDQQKWRSQKTSGHTEIMGSHDS